jgi:Flp pilus assembly secretin CpaC
MLTFLLALALADAPDDTPDDDGDLVEIPVGRSALIELGAPARAVAVTDEATVVPKQLSPTLWMLQGRKLGSTDVVIVHADGEVEALDLHVLRDISGLQRAIDRAVD